MSPAPRERPLRGTGMASRQPVVPQFPYRYRGRPGWTPESVGPMPGDGSDRAARVEEFTRAREAGLGIAGDAARAGVAYETGRDYERERRRRAGGTG